MKKVLITGTTGFIGGATLAQLLQDDSSLRIVLLVRGDSTAAARDRVARSVLRFVDQGSYEHRLRDCEVLCGDLTDLRALSHPCLDDVTHVLHLASNTSFRSVRGVRHANILGAMTLAHRMRTVKSLQRFVYVSTAYICGKDSERIVHEADFPSARARHIVEYTSSKAECEMLLANTAPELPLVVARPSVVVGHTERGCLPSASIFWFYRTAELLRRSTCPLESFDDVVPVDYVARSLLFLLFQPGLKHSCYHISAGEGSSVTWEEITRVFSTCYGERPDNPYRVVDFATLERERGRMRELLGPGDEDHLLGALKIYYDFAATEVEIFDNRRLLGEGMPPPPRFTDYLARCATQPSDTSVYQQMLDDE
ncbi:MAG: SDR family oxidoreductase [Planctomycetia bacterium]|nr:SDR family oxidoreductase [Planctomycetia bacterium]